MASRADPRESDVHHGRQQQAFGVGFGIGGRDAVGDRIAASARPELHTLGNLVTAWRNPRNHESIKQVFDSPRQVRHAVATCAAWLGVQTLAQAEVVPARWVGDDCAAPAAV